VILGFSTSSAWTSVAAIAATSGHEVIWQGADLAPKGASAACLSLLDQLLDETGLTLEDAEMFLADVGPGSFTGVRVGVTLAKTFGYLYGRPVAGATSFDLISAEQAVVLPSKKGEFFVRIPGEQAIRQTALPETAYVGFGPPIQPETYPSAARFAALIERLTPKPAEAFLPDYLIEPSISTPKKRFASSVGNHG